MPAKKKAAAKTKTAKSVKKTGGGAKSKTDKAKRKPAPKHLVPKSKDWIYPRY